MRVLFLTHRLPYAPNRGDRLRAYHMMRWLASRVELELVSLVHDSDEQAQVPAIEAMGVRVNGVPVPRLMNLARGALSLGGQRPLTHALLDAPQMRPLLRRIAHERPPHVVFAYCTGMARFALEAPLADYPFVLDVVDVDSEKWASLASADRSPKKWIYAREARCLAAFEREASLRARANLVVNERERQALVRLAPEAHVHVLPNGVNVTSLNPPSPPVEDPVVIFCGVMNYEPNVAAALWYGREIWPVVLAHQPRAKFVIAGAEPVPAVRRLAETGMNIEVTGAVPDVREYLWNAAVSVAPLRTARGLQNKVLEALSAGLPTVVTPQVLEGLPAEAQRGCRVADSACAFAEQTVSLLKISGCERRALAARADLTSLTWDNQLTPLLDILNDAADRGAVARTCP